METEVHNIEELITILKQRPQWRERLLQTLLTDEFLELPSRTNRLETAMAQLTEQVQALAEGQRQLQIRMDELTARVDKLTMQVDKLTALVSEMADTQKGVLDTQKGMLDTQKEMLDTQKGMLDDLGYLKGRDREHFYRNNASAIFGRYLRRIRVMDKGKLLERMDTAKALTDDEWQEIVALDIAVEAVTRQTERQLILAMEISWTIDGGDVERAVRRAALMRERGLAAIPVAAGKGILADAKDNAQDHRVLVALDGRIFNKEFLNET